eukprot:696023_1
MDTSTVWTHYMIFIGITWMICIPICIHYTIKFNTWKNATFIKKRHPFVVLLIIVSELLWIGVDRPLSLCRYACDYLEHHECYRYTNTVAAFAYAIISVTLMLCCVYRIWFIFYDVNWVEQTKSAKWKVLIISDTNQSWFIEHKKDYGNKHFILYKVLLPMWIIIASFFVLERMYYVIINDKFQMFATLIDSIIFISVISFGMFLLFCKTPALRDTFNIQKETRLLLIVLVFRVVGGIVIRYIFGAFIHNEFIIYLLRSYFFVLSGLCFILLQTLFVFRSLDIAHNTQLFAVSYRSVEIGSFSSSSQGKSMRLPDVLRNDEQIVLFIDHLMKEFNIECFISLVEFQRFQEYVMAVFEVSVEEVKTSITFYELCSSIPQYTTIVNREEQETETIVSAKRIAHKLFLKYIETGSAYEINISYRHRLTLEAMMCNYDAWMVMEVAPKDLISLFQQSKEEIFRYLEFSFSRFRHFKR